MVYKLVITEEAQAEANVAYLYYEEQQDGLGERFLIALQERYIAISQNPKFYSYISTGKYKNFMRDITLEKFPYIIIFEIIGNEVIVFSVHSTHKQQKKKYRG